MEPAHVAVQPWSSSVQSVLYKATHEYPDDRHQSVMDFYNDLRNIEELTRVMPRSVRRPSFESGAGKDRVFTRINVPVSTDAGGSDKDAAPVSHGIEAKEAVSALGWRLIVSEKLQSLRNGLNLRRMTAGIRVRESIAEMTRMLWVRVLGVIVLTMILLIVPPYLPKLWQGSLMPNQLARNGKLPDATELNATTDLNLRSGPSGKDQKIGLAEHYSRVRILTCNSNNTWCESEVLQHARAKQDANSADRGWVNRRYLSVKLDGLPSGQYMDKNNRTIPILDGKEWGGM